MDDITFLNNNGASRFELHRGGATAAHADYRLEDGALVFTHTEVLPQHEGQGLGSKLARFALDEVRKQGLKVVPLCSFIATYIERHPEFAPLTAGAAPAGGRPG